MPIATTEDSSRDYTADVMEWQAAESSGSDTSNTLKRKAEIDLRSEDDVTSDVQMVDLSEVESTSTLKPDKANPPDGVDGEHLLAFSSSTLGVILN
jgi:hypothetical protein